MRPAIWPGGHRACPSRIPAKGGGALPRVYSTPGFFDRNICSGSSRRQPPTGGAYSKPDEPFSWKDPRRWFGFAARSLRAKTTPQKLLFVSLWTSLVLRFAWGKEARTDGGSRMSDVEYLAQRAQQELVAAMGSSDRRTREIYLELADAYSFRLHEQRRARPFAERALLQTS